MSNMVITISREYGSGGRQIGEQLAKELGFAFYDKDLLTIIAEKTGIKEDVLQKADEEAANPLFAPYYLPHLDPSSLNDRLFKMQAELIKEKAATENCIIVGRCGNYILEDMENAIHVFIYADEEAKIVRTMERHQLNREEATKRMKKIDKQRRTYYQYYTEWRWARTEGFDIMLNSSALGVEATVAAIKAIVEAKMK